MGQIVSATAKPKRCNLNKLSQLGTPAAGEHILVSSDNSMNAAGQGNFDCYIVGVGNVAASALPLHYINPELYDAQEVHVDMAFGAVNWADGNITSKGSVYNLYTPVPIQVSKDMVVEIHNPNELTLNFVRYFYYLDGTLVNKGEIKTNTSDALLTRNIVYNGTFNEVRFYVYKGSGFTSTDDVWVSYDETTAVIPALKQRIDALEENEASVDSEIDNIKNELETLGGKSVEPELSWTNSKRVDSTNSSTSKIIAAGNTFSISDYIEIPDSFGTARVEGVQGYKGVNSYPINFYDANKVWIACSGDVKGDYDFTEIIPSNAKYVVLCQYITSSYPTANVKIFFETEAAFVTPDGVESIVSESLEPIEEKMGVLENSSTKVMITQDDIDQISNTNFVVENGSIKSASAISADGANFMLFKPDITAIEFTIGDLWDGDRFELCLGYGYYNETLVNVAAVLVAPNNYFVLDTISDGGTESGTIFAQDAREISIPIVSTGDRCMVEIVLDKYILGWVWNNTQNRWDYWFMLNPTNRWSLCNPVHTRLRYGWNERIGIGLSVMYNSAAAGLEMMKDVSILSRKGTNLETYHNAVRMGRRFSNRKWLAIGDSITAYDGLNGWGYVGYVSRRNMLDTISCGNSGWTMCDVWQKHASFSPYSEIVVDWEDAVAELGVNDVVSIFLGTNDFHAVGRTDIGTVEPYRYPTTLGTTDPTNADAKNPRTTLGALRLLIEKLQDTNPSVKIIVFAPFLRTDSDYPVNTEGMTMREFSDAICSVAKEYGLEHYNLCDYAGINAISIESLTNDGLHPNQKGGERIGEIMSRWIY